MKGAKVEFQGVIGRYGDFTALHETDLTINDGEFFALLGPSGSGKSTLLGALNGFVQPSSGAVLVNGRDLTSLPPSKRQIGMVFQNYSLFPFMTVAQNVAFPLETRKVARVEIAERVKRALDMVRMTSMSGRLPKQLSGGQQQRVALARAFVYNPSLLLMDEPLGALDKNLREEMQDEIKQLHRKIGATIIYVTHDQYEAAVLADRIAIMNHGRLEQIGTPHELYDSPRNAFVASFLGEANMFKVIGATPLNQQHVKLHTDDGFDLTALSSKAGAGEQVAFVRPECVTVSPNAQSVENRASGTVIDAVFATGLIRYRVRLNDKTVLIVRKAAAPGETASKVGDHVEVAWRAEHVHLIPN
jgi:putative spermidine/putrescine transport system ATP-binding protein